MRIVRVKRTLLARRYADKKKKPIAWAVRIEHKRELLLITSQRGKWREWMGRGVGL